MLDPTGGHGRTLVGVSLVALLGLVCVLLHQDRVVLQRAQQRTEAAHRRAVADELPTLEGGVVVEQVQAPPPPPPADYGAANFLSFPRKPPAKLGAMIGCNITDDNNLLLLRKRVLAAAAEVRLLELALTEQKKEVPPVPEVKMKTSYKEKNPRARRLYQVPFPKLPDKTVPPGFKIDPYPFIERGCQPNSAVLVSENPEVLTKGTAACAAVDVLFQRSGEGRCAVVMDQPCTWHNYVWKFEGEYWGSTSTWSLEMNASSGRPAQHPVSRHVLYAGNVMRDLNNKDQLIAPFLEKKLTIAAELAKLIGRRKGKVRMGLSEEQGRNETMLVMTANEGHSTMVVNFFCDLHSRGQPTPRHVIFATTDKLRRQLVKLGLTAFWHESLGTYGVKAEAVYGTIGFGRLTYMKQFATYLVLLLGWDVLFQDADVTWPNDPYPELLKHRDHYNAQFMDDGARTFRFAPFFANSGFYFLSNVQPGGGRIVEFWDQVTMSMAESQTGNQEVLNAILEHQVKRRGFKFRILPPAAFASGKYLPEPKEGKNAFADVTKFTVAHFCWTHNMEVKRERMGQYRSKHLRDECFNDVYKCAVDKQLPGIEAFAVNSTPFCPKL